VESGRAAAGADFMICLPSDQDKTCTRSGLKLKGLIPTWTNSPAWKFLVTLKTLTSWIMCLIRVEGRELNQRTKNFG